MSKFNSINPVSFEAGEDLSSDKNRIVMLNTSGQVIGPTAATVMPIGVLLNSPVTNAAASVALISKGGICEVVLGATLDEGARVAVEYNSASDRGKAKAAATGQYSIGVLSKGGAEDELGEVIFQPGTVEA